MPATREEARDQCMAVVRDAALLVPIGRRHVIYDSKAASKPSEDVESWLRVTLRHQGSGKRSLTGGLGTSRFERTATLTVQVFVPNGDGMKEENRVVPLIRNALEGKTTLGGLQFLDVSANEIGEDGPWWNTNVTARVVYDEFVST